jgi:hypothetical protein
VAAGRGPESPPGGRADRQEDGSGNHEQHRWRVRLAWSVTAVVSAMILGGMLWAMGRPEPAAPPPPEPTPTPTEPIPSPSPPPPPAPFVVMIDGVVLESMDNAALFGNQPQEPSRGAADAAVEEVRAVLEAYLNAAFATPATRFSDHAQGLLLSSRAQSVLSPQAQAGLGLLDISVETVDTGPASAEAHVLIGESDVTAVVLSYEAHADLQAADGGTGRLTQHGTMIFVPEGESWRTEAVDVVLEAPTLTGAGATP